MPEPPAAPKPLLAGRSRPLRIAVLVSSTGANLGTLCRLAAQRPDVVRVVLVASDRRNAPALDVARAQGIPAWPGDFTAQCGSWAQCRSHGERAAYRRQARAFHDRLTDRLEEFGDREGEIDLVVLAYHRWIHGRLLETFAGRVINQHPGDLTRLSRSGERQLIGLDPVGCALRAGADATRTSTFLVDDSHDGGAVLVQGPLTPYRGPRPVTDADVVRHELRQKEVSDRPALRAAVLGLAEGRFALDPVARHRDGSTVVHLDGRPTALGGLRLAAGRTPTAEAV
ncbi:hypothetical protein KIH74_14020 [Kineosporia sp. J2-2]|uniref:phosphoribosylglycinamide formyltransferase 1 n=1 Tax=Kineosporia corallincola TaxID=2835133 RepID=A0ABS5TIL2_9ACTN|nr:formyltransferase family protein [Kineosporia corallincola]MBT0770051.1 hypothetical protein [Kineosporia corallincola]